MKTLCIFLLSLSVLCGAENPPNILLLILDDWGVDSSPIDNSPEQNPGTTFPEMPNLQALADRGLHFANAYAQPVCSPTRATILTGRHPFRHGIGNPKQSELAASELTLPKILTARKSPYRLASFGKWHLGSSPESPHTTGGWPHFSGILRGGVRNYYKWSKTTDGTTTESTIYSTTDQVNEAIDFIKSGDVNPWFVWIGFNAPHTPFHNPPKDLTTYPQFPTDSDGEISRKNLRSAYEASLQALDTEIGRLLENIDLENTNIILIGDNGTPNRVVQAPFTRQHAKGSLYQGGIHVPLAVAGPCIQKTGTSNALVHCVDLFSTILDLAEIPIAEATAEVKHIDSQSLLPIFQNKATAPRTIISETFSHPTSSGDGRAIISSAFPDYKLIAFGDPTSSSDETKYEMYHISSDPNEQSPLGLPPSPDATYRAAYEALLTIDKSLAPQEDKTGTYEKFLYLELPENLRSAGPPRRQEVTPTSILINGTIKATFVSRENDAGEFTQFTIKCSVPEDAKPPFEAEITFPENPRTAKTRNFKALKVTLQP
ncbi:MAG: sulfatase-like hydrolase/transferase [Luteolibacter sp.]